jgi:hypothetical protein
MRTPLGGEARRPITDPRHERPCCEPGRPRFDTPAEELFIIDAVSQDDIAADQEFTRDRHLRLRRAPAVDQPPVELPEPLVAPGRRVRRLHQQVRSRREPPLLIPRNRCSTGSRPA